MIASRVNARSSTAWSGTPLGGFTSLQQRGVPAVPIPPALTSFPSGPLPPTLSPINASIPVFLRPLPPSKPLYKLDAKTRSNFNVQVGSQVVGRSDAELSRVRQKHSMDSSYPNVIYVITQQHMTVYNYAMTLPCEAREMPNGSENLTLVPRCLLTVLKYYNLTHTHNHPILIPTHHHHKLPRTAPFSRLRTEKFPPTRIFHTAAETKFPYSLIPKSTYTHFGECSVGWLEGASPYQPVRKKTRE